MDYEKVKSRVTAIIPIYNEADRIEQVLNVVSSYPGFADVLVIDDGSTDDSKKIINNFSQVKYYFKQKNEGKAKAMNTGVSLAKTDIIFFCDGDIKGLNHRMIDEIIEPVVEGRVDMFIAMRNRKIYFLHKLVLLVPFLGGERALTKELWEKVPVFYKQKFRIEAGLNFYAKYYGHGFDMKVFRGLSQTIKEKKYGFWSGFKKRLSMIVDIFIAVINLQFIDLPRDVVIFRRLIGVSLFSLLLVILGIFIIIIINIGPLTFIFKIFSDELREDPNAPMVHFLINLFAKTSRQTLFLIAYIIIIANSFVFITTILRLISNLYTTGQKFSRYFNRIKKS